ncbi:MAG: flagellar biosynthetic protein FliO [bacterium]
MGASLAWVGVLLLIFSGLALWIRRRHGVPLADQALQVRAVRRLDVGNTVWILEVDGRRLLLGSGREGVRLLTDLTPLAPPAPPVAPAPPAP